MRCCIGITPWQGLERNKCATEHSRSGNSTQEDEACSNHYGSFFLCLPGVSWQLTIFGSATSTPRAERAGLAQVHARLGRPRLASVGTASFALSHLSVLRQCGREARLQSVVGGLTARRVVTLWLMIIGKYGEINAGKYEVTPNLHHPHHFYRHSLAIRFALLLRLIDGMQGSINCVLNIVH